MKIILLLILLSLTVALLFLIAFFWAVGSGQYEDGYTPSVRILFDDNANPKTDKIGGFPHSSNKTKDRK